ncbi:MAG: thioredoxin family protein [Spirochaetia bacterium]|nr:thioredoxin family protein [Spirochaetia bacterium]
MALVESQLLKPGTELIPFELEDVNGKAAASAELKSKLLLVVFTCNHCPYAIASWPILIELQNKYGSRGYQTVAINPNNNPNYPDDAFDKMKPFAEKNGITFPYLFDANQSVAKAYGAQCTPDPYLFKDGKLFYHGRITDNWQKPELVKEHSLEMNILSALDEGPLPEKTIPSMGCSIKWVV